jgi:ABC-type sugar transport system substrate-binding protein
VDSLVIQDPFQMGYQALLTAVKHLNGQPFTRIVDLAPRLIDRQSLNDAGVQIQLHPDLQKYLE